jgi:thiosulfate/3-mercaptopyruvate sulfurtransferase
MVSPEWLAEHMGEPGLVVADVRWVGDGSPREAFEAGHLAGAIFLDADDDLSAIGQGAGRHPLPTPEAFATTMENAGVGEDTSVVVYDDAGGSHAARLWWMLDATGHRAALLDGGLSSWQGPRAAGPSPATPASRPFTARPWPAHRLADADDVIAALGTEGLVVLDARAAERYRGEIEPIDPVAGHIPGARSAPWSENLDASTGRFLSSMELSEKYRRRGVRSGADAIVYCGSGLTAALDLLAIRVAGFGTDGRLYGGSWSGWIEDPSRPVETGDGSD